MLAEESCTRNLHAAQAAEKQARGFRAATAKAQQALSSQSNACANDTRTIELLREELAKAQAHNKMLFAAIEERDVIITEWMLGDEAGKRLSRKYGNKLNVSVEAQKADLQSEILRVAEENPAYAKTPLYQHIKAAAAKTNHEVGQ